jgi:hypothetical protein
MRNRVIYIVLAVLWSADLQAQSDLKPVQKEEVSGFMEVLGYFGGKLGKELGDRLNLSDEEEKKSSTEVPTLVTVQWGPFKVERTELRPKTEKKSN